MRIKIIELAKKKIEQRDIPIEWIKETLKKLHRREAVKSLTIH